MQTNYNLTSLPPPKTAYRAVNPQHINKCLWKYLAKQGETDSGGGRAEGRLFLIYQSMHGSSFPPETMLTKNSSSSHPKNFFFFFTFSSWILRDDWLLLLVGIDWDASIGYVVDRLLHPSSLSLARWRWCDSLLHLCIAMSLPVQEVAMVKWDFMRSDGAFRAPWIKWCECISQQVLIPEEVQGRMTIHSNFSFYSDPLASSSNINFGLRGFLSQHVLNKDTHSFD